MYSNQTNWDQLAPPLAGRKLMFTTGDTWGGGSSVNSCVWVHPSAGMIREWQTYLGDDPSWSPEAVGGYIKHIEKYLGHSQDQETRGHHGPINVRQSPVNSVNAAIQAAVVAASGGTVVPVDDYNVEPLSGPALSSAQGMQLSQYANGHRSSSSISNLPEDVLVKTVGRDAASKYAYGIKGRRLLILFKSTVVRILFDEKSCPPEAIGAEYLVDGRVTRRVFAKRRVIVAAGLFTPQVLQVSGVGPRDVLEKANVKVIVENPNIGARLKDHPLLTPTFIAVTTTGYLTAGDPNTNWAGMNFLPDARGIDPTRRAVEFYPILTPVEVIDGLYITAITPVMEYVRPTSTGFVKILSSDHSKSASVSYGFLSDFDRAGIVAFFQGFFQTLLTNTGWTLSGPPTSPASFSTADINTWITATCDTSFHYGSGVTMGLPEKGGGADGSGRVYGAKKLHVIDNSLQPVPSDGNTQVAAYIIAYKCSNDIIRADKHLKGSDRKYNH